MAFSYTVNSRSKRGALVEVVGTFANSSSTGGDIDTGLMRILHMSLTVNAAVVTNAPVVNETFPLESGTATIVTGNNESGTWVAIGE